MIIFSRFAKILVDRLALLYPFSAAKFFANFFIFGLDTYLQVCQVAHTRLYELWTIHFFLRKAFAPLLPSELPVVARSYKRWTYVSVVVLHKAFLLCCR